MSSRWIVWRHIMPVVPAQHKWSPSADDDCGAGTGQMHHTERFEGVTAPHRPLTHGHRFPRATRHGSMRRYRRELHITFGNSNPHRSTADYNRSSRTVVLLSLQALTPREVLDARPRVRPPRRRPRRRKGPNGQGTIYSEGHRAIA